MNDLKKLILPVGAIFFSELLIFSGYSIAGLIVHIINLQLLTFSIIIDSNSHPLFNKETTRKVFQCLILLALLRIVNMAMPVFFTSSVFWLPLIYGVMFFPIYTVIKSQDFTRNELGFAFKPVYILPGLFIGFIFSLIEYRILRPPSMINTLDIKNILIIILVMLVFVSTVEELIFRSLLQTRLEQMIGANSGLLLTGGLFGIMHSGYGTVYEIIFTVFVGLLLGYIFQKTRSLPFTVIIHSTANVLLFGVQPFLKLFP